MRDNCRVAKMRDRRSRTPFGGEINDPLTLDDLPLCRRDAVIFVWGADSASDIACGDIMKLRRLQVVVACIALFGVIGNLLTRNYILVFAAFAVGVAMLAQLWKTRKRNRS